MESTRFTAVFDVDPEDDPFSLGRPAAFDVIRRGNLADSREDDGVGWGRTRLRASTEDPDWYVRRLAVLPASFRILGSDPVRYAMAELSRQLARSADRLG